MANYWTAFDWGRYEKKTDHLSALQHGIYFLLLKQYYKTRRPLPANAKQLFIICRAFDQAEQEAVMSILGEFFTLSEDGYHNDTADEELEKQSQITEKRSLAGKIGATHRHGKCLENAMANAKQMPTQLQSHIEEEKKPIFTTSKDSPGKWVGRSSDHFPESNNGTPDGLHELQYANRLLGEIGLPATRAMLSVVGPAIVSFANSESITKAKSFDVMLQRARDDVVNGIQINRFWFENGKYIRADKSQLTETPADRLKAKMAKAEK